MGQHFDFCRVDYILYGTVCGKISVYIEIYD